MIRLDNHLGQIVVSKEYFANTIGKIAAETFGVKGLVDADAAQGLRSFFSRKNQIDKGVRVRNENGDIIVDLHVVLVYGVNISEVVKSLANKVSYTLKSTSGLNVKRVNVYVAGMQTE